MSCLVARVPDRYHETGPRRWALCKRPDTMGAGARSSGSTVHAVLYYIRNFRWFHSSKKHANFTPDKSLQLSTRNHFTCIDGESLNSPPGYVKFATFGNPSEKHGSSMGINKWTVGQLAVEREAAPSSSDKSHWPIHYIIYCVQQQDKAQLRGFILRHGGTGCRRRAGGTSDGRRRRVRRRAADDKRDVGIHSAKGKIKWGNGNNFGGVTIYVAFPLRIAAQSISSSTVKGSCANCTNLDAEVSRRKIVVDEPLERAPADVEDDSGSEDEAEEEEVGLSDDEQVAEPEPMEDDPSSDEDEDEEQTRSVNFVVDRHMDISSSGLLDMLASEKPAPDTSGDKGKKSAAPKGPVTKVSAIDWAAIRKGASM
ncbi:hypothetical protein GGX14DRAFT_394845 [Mycena pura]|uniref:Uncharacterized protein n=1 Tax=Mycena pura TaxID=153505 RepID=A0AAD6VDP1_9AGAR|nr:hypothetical protein GGX14DRAFT_394845 [Mycena pura]